jgi:hypothetical protein
MVGLLNNCQGRVIVNIQKKIVLSSMMLSSLAGLLMAHISLAQGGIPDVSPPTCVSGCDGNDNEGNGNDNNGNDSPTPSLLIKGASVIAICANAGDPTSGCLAKTVDEASLKLGGLFVKSYFKGYLNDLFRLTVPNLYPQYQTIQLLYSVEIRTINTVQTQLENDLRKLRAFEWPTENQKEQALFIIRQDEEAINKWNNKAREEAKKGTNWYHSWNGNGQSVHDFHPGPAYEQLKTISSLGWLNR